MRIVDDSAEFSVGQWKDTVPAIPNGISQLTAAMEQHGVKPAFWYTPIFFGTDTPVFQDHPEWFGSDPETGEDPFVCTFYKNRCAVIDTSIPAAREHVRATEAEKLLVVARF